MKSEPALLLAQREVRNSAICGCGALAGALGTLLINLSSSSATPLSWFLCGVTSAFTISTWAAFFWIIHNTRRRLAAMCDEKALINDFIDKIVDELRERGDAYEAVLTLEGPAIRRKKVQSLRLH